MDWSRQLLDFWFGLEPSRHWQVDPALDAEIARRYRALWEAEKGQPDDRFLGSPDVALAAILLFDQVPRNLFRDDRRAFSTDAKARAIADAAIGKGYDAALPLERRHFAYMPFEHSEALPDQKRCLGLMKALGSDQYYDFALKHHDVIARFGRFPHRNAVLGREPTEAEVEFGLDPAW